MTHPLIELQAADTMADQLRHRRDNLVERGLVQGAKNELVRWNQARLLTTKRLEELATMIAESEAELARVDKERDRLVAQRKRVITPREAEALQSQIAGLDTRRSELEDAALAAMEEQVRLDDQLAAHLSQERQLKETYLAADAELVSAQKDIDNELSRLDERLAELRAAIAPGLLRRYDRLRSHHVIAAAGLSGSRCDGCHLDLSAAELDEIRSQSADGGCADCPQCGRILVP